MKILALLQELKYLKLQLKNKVEFQYTGACQFESTRPTRPTYRMTSVLAGTRGDKVCVERNIKNIYNN